MVERSWWWPNKAQSLPLKKFTIFTRKMTFFTLAARGLFGIKNNMISVKRGWFITLISHRPFPTQIHRVRRQSIVYAVPYHGPFQIPSFRGKWSVVLILTLIIIHVVKRRHLPELRLLLNTEPAVPHMCVWRKSNNRQTCAIKKMSNTTVQIVRFSFYGGGGGDLFLIIICGRR